MWDLYALDLKHAARNLFQHAGTTAVMVLTLALGIGVNAAMFGVVDPLLLRQPAHVTRPERVMKIYFREKAPAWAGNVDQTAGPVTTFPVVAAFQADVRSLDQVAGLYTIPRTIGSGADAETGAISLVTGNFFSLLGVQPMAGRFFTSEEDRPPLGVRVAVLSHGYWLHHFTGSREAIGASILIDREAFTVIGVAPAGFNGVDLGKTDIWTPISALASKVIGPEWLTGGSLWIRAIGRLAPGETPDSASAEATVVFRRTLDRLSSERHNALRTVVAGPLIGARGPEEMPGGILVSLWLAGVSAIVLLVACANCATLLMLRGMQRRREMAVRLAVGAGRARLVALLFSEAVLLTVLAAAAALVFAQWAGGMFRTAILPGVAWPDPLVDGRVLAFTMGVMVVTATMAGIAPALGPIDIDIAHCLKVTAPGSIRSRSRIHTALLMGQVALSVVLLVGAGLFVRSLTQVRAIDVGIDLDRVLVAKPDLKAAGIESPRALELFKAACTRIQRLPGVESATVVGASIPMRSANALSLRLPGRETLPVVPGGGPYFSAIDSRYFATVGTRVLRGRGITDHDEGSSARVMVVNETLARAFWPGKDPIGQCVVLERSSCTEVVGVVQNVGLFGRMDERGLYYLPATHPRVSATTPEALLVRVSRSTPTLAGAVRREIEGSAPEFTYVDVASYADLFAPELQPWRLGALMFTVFGILALGIATIGVYSVVAFVVTQQIHDIGVRVALGASRSDVVMQVVGNGMKPIVAGLFMGLVAALVGGRWLQPLLYHTEARDPQIIFAVVGILAAAAAVACAVPAYRASRLNALVALRAE